MSSREILHLVERARPPNALTRHFSKSAPYFKFVLVLWHSGTPRGEYDTYDCPPGGHDA